MKLSPAIVTLHLLGGLVLLALFNADCQQRRPHSSLNGTLLECMGLRVVVAPANSPGRMGRAPITLSWRVIIPAVPKQLVAFDGLCQWFHVWRPLGLDASGEALTFEALTAIHYVHRLSAYVVFIALGALAWRLMSHRHRHADCKNLGRVIAATTSSRVSPMLY
jgi:cytochrome c oxidase assembly protein subunit 15